MVQSLRQGSHTALDTAPQASFVTLSEEHWVGLIMTRPQAESVFRINLGLGAESWFRVRLGSGTRLCRGQH